jgi:hypothetical protein
MNPRVSPSCLQALFVSNYPDITWPSLHCRCDSAVHVLCARAGARVCVCVCVCVIFQFFYLFCSLFLSSKWHCFREAYKFNDSQPASKPVDVLVTTTPTHLPGTSHDVIGDIVEPLASYEFNSLTYLLWLLPYLYLSWRVINLSRTWNFRLYEMRILIYIHIRKDRPPFIVLYMSCYPVNWNKVWHRWVSTVCRSIRFVLYAILTDSIRTFFVCFTNYSLAGGCQKVCW